MRDQLKLGLSERVPEGGTPVPELADKIRELRASVTVEAAPERTGTRKAVRAERPVTARIRERLAPQEARVEPKAEEASLVQVVAEPVAEIIPLPVAKPVEEKPIAPQEVVIPAMYQGRGHAGRVTRRREDGAQLRLF